MNRRMFIRSASTTLWLPFLPSALPRAAWSSTPPTSPRRALWWFMPNGFVRDYVTPAAEGPDYDLPFALEGIAPLQSRISVLSGLENRATDNYDAHEQATPTLLGDHHVYNTFSGTLDGSITVDQWAAQVIGTQTPFGSLQLGTDEPYLSAGGNIDILYRSLSWSSPTTPLASLDDPKTVFDRMFAGTDTTLTEAEIETRRELRKSLLDSVLDRTNGLKAKLNTTDKEKLDQFTTGIRDLENRIDALAALECPTPATPSSSPGFQEKVSAMTDLMVVALQCDYTRLITFMTGISTSTTVYGFLGHGLDHHSLSHNWAYNTGDANRLQEVYNWQVARWVDLCTKLSQVATEDGDLLSHTAAHFVSEFGESNLHQAEPLTVLLAGGEAGGIAQGQHRVYPNTPHSNLWMSILDFLQVDGTGFGTTSTGSVDLS